MRTDKIFFFIATFCAISCGGNKGGGRSAVHYTPVSVPSVITEEGPARDYMLSHWFDGWKSGIDSLEAESVFSTWASMASESASDKAAASLISNMYRDSTRLLRFAGRYLYDPNSPFRDEDIYGKIAAHCGMQSIAALCSLNAVGTTAADFVFETSKGKNGSLMEIKADYTILMFSNPGCSACKSIINDLMTDPIAAEAIQSGRIAVLSMYIDEDLELWREHLPDYPRKFICAFDPSYTLRDNDLYNIRAIPSLYLLDDRKTVLLKDATSERLLNYITRL